MRALRRGAGALLVLVLALALALLLGAAVPRPVADLGAAGPARHVVVLVANPIHTDIALPATPEVLERLGFLTQSGLPLDHPGVGAVLVGWGGREFYTQTPTWADLTPGAVLASVTRDASVLHFALVPPLPPDLPLTRRLMLDDAQLDALLGFIARTLQRDPRDEPIEITDAGYGAFDRFFEARGWFNVAVGCNVWTSAALAAAGLSTGWWTPLPQTLLTSLDWHGGARVDRP